MKTVKQLQLLSLAVMLLAVSACQSKPKDGLTDTYTSGVIAIAADESFQPIVQEEVDVFEGLFPLAGIVPRYVTEVEAVNLLLKDSLRLAFVFATSMLQVQDGVTLIRILLILGRGIYVHSAPFVAYFRVESAGTDCSLRYPFLR